MRLIELTLSGGCRIYFAVDQIVCFSERTDACGRVLTDVWTTAGGDDGFTVREDNATILQRIGDAR